jgi:hypothetical protein
MLFPLGAMSSGDILDRGLKMLFARLPTFFAINLIVMSPLILMEIGFPLIIYQGDSSLETDYQTARVGYFFLLVFLTLALQPVAIGAILHIVMQQFLGKRTTMGEALSFSLTRFSSLLGASLLVGLIVAVGTVICCLPGIILYLFYIFGSYWCFW